jgi:hypothetical protein
MILSSQDLARRTAVLAELHIVEQEQRISRQQELVATLERDGHQAMAVDARRLLAEMRELLACMHDDLEQANRRIDDR